ncbi:hypothetical protein AZH46_07155 [Corynebacterium striatum]|nr:hypothetical protein AZH46_00185 [Corynebacterium striatum]PIS66337.1 hypothetical protein AZH46_07155 [Corynebacterium striatum]HAT1243357.1 hypothetical protein [Corynebacterium striatum]
MLIFAQPTDVQKWADNTFDGVKLEPLIRRASSLVQYATRAARFDVQPSGMPEDPDVMDALRDATCEQVAVWVENDITPGKLEAGTAQVTSSSIGDASVGMSGAEAAAARDNAANTLCEYAQEILANAGLIGGFPWVR